MSAEMQREREQFEACYRSRYKVPEHTPLNFPDVSEAWEWWQAARRSQGQEGWKLAMRVMQSDLYSQLDDAERAECDALARTNPCFPAPSGEVKE